MSRDIKFRAWDLYGEGMIPHDSLMRQRYGDVNNNVFNDDTHVIEQYTGLKDKNGVEIYEGDTLSIDGENIGNVIFRGCTFDLDGWYDAGDFYTGSYAESWDWSAFEVIGNIHEGVSK